MTVDLVKVRKKLNHINQRQPCTWTPCKVYKFTVHITNIIIRTLKGQNKTLLQNTFKQCTKMSPKLFFHTGGNILGYKKT